MDVPHLSHLNFLKSHLCLPLLFDFSIRKIIKSLIESLNLPHKLFFERIYCILIVISLLFQLNLSGWSQNIEVTLKQFDFIVKFIDFIFLDHHDVVV